MYYKKCDELPIVSLYTLDNPGFVSCCKVKMVSLNHFMNAHNIDKRLKRDAEMIPYHIYALKSSLLLLVKTLLNNCD